jgi:hypothetical protein
MAAISVCQWFSGAAPETTRRRWILPQMLAVVFQMGEDFFVCGSKSQ